VPNLFTLKKLRSAHTASLKYTSMFAVLATVFAGSIASASATPIGEAFTYTVNADSSATVTGCTGTCPTNLVIPATLGGHTVRSLGDWSFVSKRLTSVTLPDSLASIGAGALGDNALSSIVIPQSVTSIADDALQNNQLSTLNLPTSLTRIGKYALAGNKLTSVTLPASVSFIADRAFVTNLLKSVTFTGNCPALGNEIFLDNPELTSVTVPYVAENCGLTLSGVTVNRAAPIGKPATPPKIRWVEAGNSHIRVAIWSPQLDGGSAITRYEYTLNDGVTWAKVDPSSTNALLIIRNLQNGTRYDVKVRAFNAAGAGMESNTGSGLPRTLSDAPIINAATGHSAKIQVDFTAPEFSGGEVITRYAFSVNGGSWHSWNYKATDTTQYIRGLKPGVACSIRLRAFTAAGWGAISNEVTATPTR
jgi:BspA type Leucine rich repeat region (6 copies)/Fibronectin type III domain